MKLFSQVELDYLQGQQLGRIATVSSEHNPYVSPVAFASDAKRIYLNIEYDSKKARNIKKNP